MVEINLLAFWEWEVTAKEPGKSPAIPRVFDRVTAYELAKRLGMSYDTVKHWKRTGIIPTREIRNVAEVTGAELDDILPPAS